jgi:rhodanese-related sulfurtransferase
MDTAQLAAFVSANPILSLAFVGLSLALIANEIARLRRPYKSVSPAGLTELVNREDALVIDVSPLNDYDKGHIAGSRNLVASQLEPGHKLLAKAQDSAVVLVCRSGQQSGEAASRLAKAGFRKVFWLDGGIAAWQQADLPLAKGRG